ncbi:MAG: ABC transporter ATP-binding protein [Chloroflexi bacterium]|nr:ABC transporter ATP-binding protein [Chloroflexota bacterium]
MLIRTERLGKTYATGWFNKTYVSAVNNVDLTIRQGETIGVLGESGSGKSTLGLMLAGLLKPSRGKIYYEDEPVGYPFKGKIRRDIQILFQHPEISFNPKLVLGKSLNEVYKLYDIPAEGNVVEEHIRNFGLYKEHLERYPHQLSGGELQRAALARILIIKPKVIVLDEPTSMLDYISQAQVIKLLNNVKQEENLAYFFITHNIKLAEIVSDRIIKIEGGEVIEERRVAMQ